MRELKATLTRREFREYVAYWELEPFGDEIRQLAQIAWLMYSAHGGQQQKRQTVEDFMPRLVRTAPSNDAADVMWAWAEAAIAKDKQQVR